MTIADQITQLVKSRNEKLRVAKELSERVTKLKETIEATMQQIIDENLPDVDGDQNTQRYAEEVRKLLEKFNTVCAGTDECPGVLKELEDLLLLVDGSIGRFVRGTFDVGVAGGTQAGKTSTLMHLTGVQFGIGNGAKSTTAANSIFRNVPVDSTENGKADVFFYSWDEFATQVLTPIIMKLNEPEIRQCLERHNIMVEGRIPCNVTDFGRWRVEREDEKFGVHDPSGLQDLWDRYVKIVNRKGDYIGLLSRKDRKIGNILHKEAEDYLVYPENGNPKLLWPAVKDIHFKTCYPVVQFEQSTFSDIPGRDEVGAPDVEFRYKRAFTLQKDVVLCVYKWVKGTPDGKFYQSLETLQQQLPANVLLCDYLPFFYNDWTGPNVEVDDEDRLGAAFQLLQGRFRDMKYVTVLISHDGNEHHPSSYRVFRSDKPSRKTVYDGMEWEELEGYDFSEKGPVVIFGRAKDKNFVQGCLMEGLCQFAAQRANSVDEACITSIQDKLKEIENKTKSLLKSCRDGLDGLCREGNIRPSVPTRAVDWAERLQNLMFAAGCEALPLPPNGRQDGEGKEMQCTENPQAKQTQIQFANELCHAVAEQIGPQTGMLLYATKQQLEQEIGERLQNRPQGLKEDLVIRLRRGLLKAFSQIQDKYEKLMDDLLETYFLKLKQEPCGLPILNFSPEQEGTRRRALKAWIDLLPPNEGPKACPTLRAAAEALYNLRIDYYSTLYPKLRDEFYGASKAALDELTKVNNTKDLISVLGDVARQWITNAKKIFRECDNYSVVCCAFERFLDETRNSPPVADTESREIMPGSDEEFKRFCEYNWEKFESANEENSPFSAIDRKVERVLQPLGEMFDPSEPESAN